MKKRLARRMNHTPDNKPPISTKNTNIINTIRVPTSSPPPPPPPPVPVSSSSSSTPIRRIPRKRATTSSTSTSETVIVLVPKKRLNTNQTAATTLQPTTTTTTIITSTAAVPYPINTPHKTMINPEVNAKSTSLVSTTSSDVKCVATLNKNTRLVVAREEKEMMMNAAGILARLRELVPIASTPADIYVLPSSIHVDRPPSSRKRKRETLSAIPVH
jgi:hypothetical protein